MKWFVKGIEEVLVAITFSEVGEYAVARESLAVSASSIRTGMAAETQLPAHTPLVPEGDP
jgi:hypothetical protein